MCSKVYDHIFLVQLYVPPEYMINKDFLKEVFAEEKDLLELKDVKWINVPLFDELSVVNIWPMTKEDKQIKKVLPRQASKRPCTGQRILLQYSEHVPATVCGADYSARK